METVQLISKFISPPLPSSPSVHTNPSLPPLATSQPNGYLLFALLVLPALAYLTYKDYNAFLSLGPGGTPSTFLGYLKITALRFITLRNTRVAGPIPEELQDGGYLSPIGVPKRNSKRPIVAGIAPHRQINQKPSKEIYDLLCRSIVELANDHPKKLKMATSCFEKHCSGLFSINGISKTCNGEVAHAHPFDGSLHLTLHPKDAKAVIEAGWGERHPLARGGWCTRFVPLNFIMVYAPRTEEEVKTVMDIILAGYGWVSGEVLSDSNTEFCSERIDVSARTNRNCHPETTSLRNESGVVTGVANMIMETA